MNARLNAPRLSGLLFLLSLAAIGTAAAQLSPSTQVASRMVVTAVASKGSDVPAISREDVMVREGKDRDKVLDWVAATGDHAGLELFLMIDDSAGDNVGSQLEDMRKFILAQPATTAVGVAYMQNGTAQVLQDADRRSPASSEDSATPHRSTWRKRQSLFLAFRSNQEMAVIAQSPRGADDYQRCGWLLEQRAR